MTKEELKKEAEEKCVCTDEAMQIMYRIGYIDGAEPREKRIEELIALINAERERQEKCDDVHLRKIAELEKENAELKGLKDVATLIRANNDTVTTLMQLNNMLVSRNQQLTKAKEIIKELLNLPFASDEEVFADVSTILGKAEQFLSEGAK